MTHTLPSLPYLLDGLAPYISSETLEYHSGKHHQAYVDNLNRLIVWTEYENMDLEEIIKKSPVGGIFNNAAQVWNHTFYFESLTPVFDILHFGNFFDAISAKWGSVENFQTEFSKAALANFGSGWTWLVRKSDRSLDIVSTSNAGIVMPSETNPPNPLCQGGMVPLLTCDVWEHAYYIDYRNARAKYLENFWHVVNWAKVEERFNSI